MTAPDCPDTGRCPVPDPDGWDLARLRTVSLPAGLPLHTAHRRSPWPDGLFNGGGDGDSRFAPLSDAGVVVPTLYAARTRTVALLESVFHEVAPTGRRLVSEAVDLRPRGLARLVVPAGGLRLYAFDDAALDDLGLTRAQVVTAGPEHYRCTRAWADRLRRRHPGGTLPAGILWLSRIAELHDGSYGPVAADLLTGPNRQVMVVFGDRVTTDPGSWGVTTEYGDLTAGMGRALVDEVADQIKATITP